MMAVPSRLDEPGRADEPGAAQGALPEDRVRVP